MAFDNIVRGLDAVRRQSASNSFFVSQVETRGNNITNFLIEVWDILKSLGETIKNAAGVGVRTALWLPRQIVHISGLERLNDAVPNCTDFGHSFADTVILSVGAASTAVFGVVLSPVWNYEIHQILGIVPSKSLEIVPSKPLEPVNA